MNGRRELIYDPVDLSFIRKKNTYFYLIVCVFTCSISRPSICNIIQVLLFPLPKSKLHFVLPYQMRAYFH